MAIETSERTQPAATSNGGFAYGPPVAVVVSVKVTALAFREADGGDSVVVPELPGLVTGCDGIEDVEAMVADAAEAWLPVQHDKNRDETIRGLTEPLDGEGRS